ncbi:hypothetical protein D1BOALGB6SA_9628 [Olavius sp. associated proteobacterium Delta 1]|nr:hypothetical protein D1BOALGB6SA_9628 [Olavius sp. associated proteobacterium Delta 1]
MSETVWSADGGLVIGICLIFVICIFLYVSNFKAILGHKI